MRLTIHQPDFLPWLGFFDRWRASDLLVLLDDVQFLRRGWHHRDRIKTAAGPAWLTVPVKSKGRYLQTIREVELEDGPWRRKHLAMIRAAYARAPGFELVFPPLEAVYARNHARLADLNRDLLALAAGLLDIRTPTALASDHDLPGREGPDCAGTVRLLRLCRLHGASVYLTGVGSRDYLDESLLLQHGVRVEWQRFEHPVYPQLHGAFAPNLSVLDWLMMRPSQAFAQAFAQALPETLPEGAA